MAPSDDELSKIEQEESLSMEQESEVQEMQAVKDEVVEHEGMNEDVVSEELNETPIIDQDLNEHSNSHEDEVPVPNEEENSKE